MLSSWPCGICSFTSRKVKMRPLVKRNVKHVAGKSCHIPRDLVHISRVLDDEPLFKPYAYTNGIMHYPSMTATPVTYRKVLSQ